MEETQIGLGSKVKMFFDKFLFWILIGLSFLVPIFFLPFSFVSIQFGTSLLFATGAIISILVYIISGLFSGSVDLPKPGKYVLGFTLLVPVVYTLAGVANGFSRMSFFGYTFDPSTVGFVFLSFAYMFLISVLFKNKNRILFSYMAFILSSIIFAVFLLSRLILGAKFLSLGTFTDLTTTTIGSWNNVSIFFGIGLILSLLTYQMLNVSRLMKIILTITSLVSLFFLALVNFSVVWTTLSITAFLFILYSLFNSGGASFSSLTFKQKLYRIPLYPSIVFVVSITFIVFGSSFGNYLSNTLKISNVEVRPSLSVTMNIARNTIKSQPLFGSGPNTFVNEWLLYRPDEITTSAFWNTDFTNGIGLIPTFAVTTGLLGVLSWLVFLGFYAYLGVKSIFTRIEDSFVKYLLTSSFFVSLYLWVMTFVYVPSTVILILTFFFTGLFFASVYSSGMISVVSKSFSGNPKSGFVSSLIMIVLLVSGAWLAYGIFQNSKSLWYFQKSSYALNTDKNITTSENYMVQALNTVPNDVYFRALSQIEILKLNAILSQDIKQIKPEEIQKQFQATLSDAIKAGLSAKEADSSNYLNWISLGDVYGSVSLPQLKVDGAYESAQLAYSEALHRNPKNPAILMLFARLAVTREDLKSAQSYAEQAIQAKNNYLDAYFLLSQIEVADKNINGAISSVTSASVIDPTNPAIFFQLGLLKYNISDFKGAIEALEKATNMTPDYANAKYFLGLSYEATGQHQKAIKQFQDLKVTNPDSTEVDAILNNLLAGKSIFANSSNSKPEKADKLPVKEKVQ